MKYVSTRGNMTPKSFNEILLAGLAPDGGLYMPISYPQISYGNLNCWRELSYAELAYEIFSLFVDEDIDRIALFDLVSSVYTPETFGSSDITPVRRLGNSDVWIQNLSGGPTAAFKDVGLLMLGAFFENVLGERDENLNILGATSGDTGSAAIQAMLGRANIKVFMLSPKGRMTPFQEAQMWAVDNPNIHNLVIDGTFDQAQNIVKTVSANADFKKRYSIGAVNSINWARIMSQVVYYFYGYLKVTKESDELVNFSVPSGNFGNMCAGWIARKMGLPIKHLVVATNENDVLDEFFKTGRYRPRKPEETSITSSPSMDISQASNFERFIWDILGRNFDDVLKLFKDDLGSVGQFVLEPEVMSRIRAQSGILSGSSDHASRLWTIALVHSTHNTTIDPHTADALSVLWELDVSGPTIVLETALPVKFDGIMQEALGLLPPRPKRFIGIEELPRKFELIEPEAELVMDYIRRHTD